MNNLVCIESNRGFRIVKADYYPPNGEKIRLVQESSSVGDYEDSLECAGSSYLWVGDNIHLDREEVSELVRCLQYWLTNKRLPTLLTE